MMGKKKERMLGIIDVLKKNSVMSVKSLAEMFKVSEMTIRRDLEALSSNGIVSRSYGYATFLESKQVLIDNDEYYDISFEQIKNSTEKNAIANFAASLVEPQDFIMIDSGTTTFQFSKQISSFKDISVLCYNFGILAELRKNIDINIIFAGGHYFPEDQMFTSKENVEFIHNLRANKAFISASGIHESLGITCIHSHEIENKRAIIESSMTRILLMDSSKFGVVRPSYFASFTDIDIIITDSGIDKAWQDIINEAGIKLYIV